MVSPDMVSHSLAMVSPDMVSHNPDTDSLAGTIRARLHRLASLRPRTCFRCVSTRYPGSCVGAHRSRSNTYCSIG
jgi:hypothetical protein